MLRFFRIFLVSLLLTSQMIPSGHAAVKWNNGGVKDDKSDPEKYWRKAEKDWERSRWSETRNRWEQYIHGYEAGHPAFGVKKSYHLPRKE